MKKILFIYVLIPLFFACGAGKESEERDADQSASSSTQEQKDPDNNSSSDPSLSSGMADRVSIKDKKGFNIVGFEISTNEYLVTIEGNKPLVGQTKGDKTKYTDEKGDIVAEVKHKDDGFKVKNVDGKLLWKVKMKDGKIKISDNEEGENPMEVKKREDDSYKVVVNEQEIGKVKWKDGVLDIDGPGADLKLSVKKSSYAYGVLLLAGIPKTERYIIMAELLAKGL